jgi:hypothetical protein
MGVWCSQIAPDDSKNDATGIWLTKYLDSDIV